MPCGVLYEGRRGLVALDMLMMMMNFRRPANSDVRRPHPGRVGDHVPRFGVRHTPDPERTRHAEETAEGNRPGAGR